MRSPGHLKPLTLNKKEEIWVGKLEIKVIVVLSDIWFPKLVFNCYSCLVSTTSWHFHCHKTRISQYHRCLKEDRNSDQSYNRFQWNSQTIVYYFISSHSEILYAEIGLHNEVVVKGGNWKLSLECRQSTRKTEMVSDFINLRSEMEAFFTKSAYGAEKWRRYTVCSALYGEQEPSVYIYFNTFLRNIPEVI